jgi:hypothetical protein
MSCPIFIIELSPPFTKLLTQYDKGIHTTTTTTTKMNPKDFFTNSTSSVDVWKTNKTMIRWNYDQLTMSG